MVSYVASHPLLYLWLESSETTARLTKGKNISTPKVVLIQNQVVSYLCRRITRLHFQLHLNPNAICEFHRLVKHIFWKNQTLIAMLKLQPRRKSNLSKLISLNSEINEITCLAFHSPFGDGEDVVSRAF